MKNLYFTLALVCTAITLPAYATTGGMQSMGNMGNTSSYAAKAHAFMGHGQINSVHPDTGTVNITMGAIKALGWPDMAMSLPVQKKTMLNGFEVGEIVHFDVAKDATGGYVITAIAPDKP